MLSYKHGYHAGNHADVFKHIILIYLYNQIKKHHKSISYIDTHSGNGRYKYISKYMEKNREYMLGIKKIEKYEGDNYLINNYLRILKNIDKQKNFYPGSPYIISNISQKTDRLYFCELHNNEFKDLKLNLNKFPNTKIINLNGFEYINDNINNKEKFFILVDPSYEIKEDFYEIYNLLNNIHSKFEKSKIIIWYPILNYLENDIFIDNIRKKGINSIINVELPIIENNDDRGMKGSGLLLINFKDKKIFTNLKLLMKDLQICLRQSDNVYKSKIRYL